LVARALGLPESRVVNLVQRLERLGFVEFVAGAYVVTRNHIHLPTDSPLFDLYRLLHRQKSLEQIQRCSADETFNFTAIFSADEGTYRVLRSQLLEFIKSAEGLVRDAETQHVYQLNFDLLQWNLDDMRN
jgi:hypothetical protein